MTALTQRDRLAELVESHQARLYGFLRCRTKDDATAQDLVQRTWLEVWRRFNTFDESKGSFWTFTKIWAGIVTKRHWSERESEPAVVGFGDSDDETDATVIPGAESLPATFACSWPVHDEAAFGPELEVDAARVLADLLHLVAGSTRPPHEVITFLYSRLKWKPAEIVTELSPEILIALLERVEGEYARVVRLSSVATLLQPLHDRLERQLGEIVEDPRTRKLYEGLEQRVAAYIALREFFVSGDDPAANVTRWWDSLKRAVFAELRASGRGDLLAWSAAT